jgi:hypothetical protein
MRKASGRIAVLASRGADCYYHWLFDVLPRAGLLGSERIDGFIIQQPGYALYSPDRNILWRPVVAGSFGGAKSAPRGIKCIPRFNKIRLSKDRFRPRWKRLLTVPVLFHAGRPLIFLVMN